MKKCRTFILLIILLCSCSVSKNESDILSTSTSELNATQPQATVAMTSISIPTATPFAIWDKTLSVKQQPTPLYPGLEIITKNNITKMEEVARWGLGFVKGIALSPDKSTIVVSTSTGIYLYDKETLFQKEKINFGVESDAERIIWCKYWFDNIDFSPDGKFLAIGEDEINIWDLNSNQLHAVIKQPDGSPESNVVEVKYSEDGRRILISRANKADYPCNTDGRFEIYDTANGEMLSQITFRAVDAKFEIYSGHENEVFFSTGYKLFTVNTANGELLSESEVGQQEIYDLPVMLNTDKDGVWEIYNSTQKEKCLLAINEHESSYPWMMDYSVDGMMAITFGRGSGDLNVWDFENCRKSVNFLFFPEPSRDIGFSPFGNYLVTGSLRGSHYYLWNAVNGEPLFPVMSKYLAFNFDESQLYALLENKASHLEIVNALTNDVLYQRDHNGSIYSFSQSKTDANLLLIGNQLVNLSESEKMVKEFDGSTLYFSPDGKRIASLNTFNQKPEAYLSFFDTTTGLPLYVSEQLISYSSDIQYSSINYLNSNFSSDWHYFAAVATEKIIIWNVETQGVVSEIETQVDDTVTFSNDGSLLFTRAFRNLESAIEVWEVETGKLLNRFKAPLGVWENQGLVLSPDGKLLAFLAKDDTIRVFGVKIP